MHRVFTQRTVLVLATNPESPSLSRPRAMLRPLVLLLGLDVVAAYGEGNADVIMSDRWGSGALEWDADGDIARDCEVVAAGTAVDARVLVTLPDDASELNAAEVCVRYTVRSDTAENWWFVAPPPAEPLRVACAPVQRTRPITVALDGLVLPRGYTRLTVWLHQPRDSTTPLVAALDAAVAVVEPPAGRPAWLGPPHLGLDDSTARGLAESFRVVREDERPEKEAYVTRTREGRDEYRPLHAWDEELEASLSPLRELLSPELLAALERPSPAALWRLVQTPSPRHPVHQLRLFSAAGARRLASELAHAHASAALDHSPPQPTNNVSDTVGAQAAAVGAATLLRQGPPSLLLDEVRLHAVAHALAARVLAPLARLLYPEWTLGGQLDSYHAFSIHRRAAAADQESWFRPASDASDSSDARAAAAAAAAAAPASNASASAAARSGVHSDVCEVSLNVALRASADLVGSRVGFEPGFAAAAAAAAEEEGGDAGSSARGVASAAGVSGADDDVLWLDHAAGHAFVNLCQHRHGVDPLVRGSRDTIVVRGFASGFRRAPAEGWYQRCVAPREVRDKHGVKTPERDELCSQGTHIYEPRGVSV